jgi:hypothetical protein
MSVDLHARLSAAIRERLEVARAATSRDHVGGRFYGPPDAATIRRCEALLRVVERHVPEPGQHPDFCGHDKHQMPCPDIRDLAAGEGIEERSRDA